MTAPSYKTGFIGCIGRPNSGKSTLVNTLLDEELCVVTNLPQTTRKKCRGIYTDNDKQLIFVDTPGIHQGNHAFNKRISQTGLGLLKDKGIDCLCYLVDLFRPFGEEEDFIASHFREFTRPLCIVFTKEDCVENPAVVADTFFNRYPWLHDRPSVRINAQSATCRAPFFDAISPFIPAGPPLYAADDITDENLRYFAGEFLQKSIMVHTKKEVPHAAFVEITGYREYPRNHVVTADIHVETTGQRAICIGKKGSMIRQIREAAQRDLSALVGVAVQYKVFVKITPKWRDNARFLAEHGFTAKENSRGK